MSSESMHPLQHDAEHEAPRKRPSALGYFAALFAAALLLLGLTYLMQQRSNEAALTGLTQSISAMQSVENLLKENEALHDETARLETEIFTQAERIQELEAQLEGANQGGDVLVESIMRNRDIIFALDLLRLLEQAYGAKEYTTARELIAQLEDLSEFLPQDPLHIFKGRYAPSPAERFGEITDALD